MIKLASLLFCLMSLKAMAAGSVAIRIQKVIAVDHTRATVKTDFGNTISILCLGSSDGAVNLLKEKLRYSIDPDLCQATLDILAVKMGQNANLTLVADQTTKTIKDIQGEF